MSIYKGTTLLSGIATNTISNAHTLLDWKWSDHIINSMEWLRADTFSWQSGDVYTSVYNHLVADNSGGTSTTETVGSYTITYVLADDGHKITTDETTVANIYNESGVAWYYVLDTTNQRFKLPRTKYGFVGLRDAVGKYVPESLPSLPIHTTGVEAQGFGLQNSISFLDRVVVSQFNSSDTDTISSGVYQDNAPVQQRATQMYLYFYVGQYNQSATEQTAGLNSELFNGKADIDLSNAAPNASASAKQTIAGWIIPDLTTGVSQSNSGFTSTKKQWLRAFCSSAGYDAVVKVNGDTVIETHIGGTSSYPVYSYGWYLLDVGDVVTTTIGSGSVIYLTTYNMKGL